MFERHEDGTWSGTLVRTSSKPPKKAHIAHVGTFDETGWPTGWCFDKMDDVALYEVTKDGVLLVAGWPVDELQRIAVRRA